MSRIIYSIIFLMGLFAANYDCFAQTVKRERQFNPSGLYGYMNGGTDQFLEYDVQQLVVRDIAYKNEDYTVEVYEMATPRDAFGIYSLHVFKCLRADTAGCINCRSPYQLQAVSGNRYLSIVYPSDSPAAREGADELLRLYLPADGTEKPEIPALLEMQPPYSGNLKYLRGPLSLSSAAFSLTRLLEGISCKGIWFVPLKPSNHYRALICVQDNEEVKKIEQRITPSQIIRVGEDYIYITGTGEESETTTLF